MKANNLYRSAFSLIGILAATVFSGCKTDYLKPDPLSFYSPEVTFKTRAGLDATIAMADRHLRTYWSHTTTRDISVPINTEYMLSDIAVSGKTDDGNIFADVSTRLTPTNGIQNDDVNMISFFWGETYNGIKYANTITSFIDNVPGLDQATKQEYLGRAYFHRAFRYLALCFQFKDVPLVTKILTVPKQNYKTTSREAILEMITADMEKAVEWVPDQSGMQYIGMINKAACRQLLIKCYLATGQWDKAIVQANILINNSGYALMTNTFGTFDNPSPLAWPVTRNVIWDLHRPVNKAIAANKEVLLLMPNRENTDATIRYKSMRNWGPMWNQAALKSPSGKVLLSAARTASNYRAQYDINGSVGRGLGMIRPTHFAQFGLWQINGVNDATDLRHSAAVGNWATMEALKYNDPADSFYGQNLRLYNGTTLLCTDTIRSWFNWPHYKVYIDDPVYQANLNSNRNDGGAADWYCYRLAETYLLRAEAQYYKGNISAATEDVNTVRRRAQCSQFYTSVNIGDIVNERARELYMEEWRHMELSRISYSLALSGKPDEFGNVYTKDALSTNNYWFQRIQKYNDYYNKNKVTVRNRSYTIAAYNIYWPIPQTAINSNLYGKIRQNEGYTGFDAGTSVWTKWQDAVADEDTN
ncbi:RagB/SusD family nutrient uptake outer membrane protein [Mucilaginibacter sp. Bleaf8]|uniref:RagB/SusD family nutrient uptake outer membrane protein n=1 Tax=Mucilaginibacter sp. Bleaf8 TaxID=2834430 RepID=UPI001BCCD0B7|nr:RagB/SusD family nutrient uptake outer membrane protein [Mucilaginibacter sp. Bleaf8]MBS7564702.1 RagB/SusD family nutrient uptake outer membrane protein [Mucilaginibacter sp. Bleaf8]